MAVVVPRRPGRRTLSSGWASPSRYRCPHHRPGCCFLPSNLVAVAIALAAVTNARFVARHPHPPLSPSPSLSPSSSQSPSLAPPPSCRQRRAVALPPPPLTLPPLPHRRQATSRCLAAALPSPLRRRQAAADLALSRCRHRHCCHRRAAVRWLVVVLLSAVRFRHCMPSCDHQRSRCWPLLPINCLAPPPPATAAAAGPPGRHNRHRHHRGRTHRRTLVKKAR